MPNIKSAKKRVLVSKLQNEKNRAAKSALKTQLKKFDADQEIDGDLEKVSKARGCFVVWFPLAGFPSANGRLGNAKCIGKCLLRFIARRFTQDL